MSERSFQLQRFYFGLLKNSPQANKPLVLARSAAITPAQISECLTLARLEAPAKAVSAEMPSAFALFRGQSIDYILSFAQINAAGLPQLQYILLDAAVMAWVGGNFSPFMGLAHAEMPLFDSPRDNLAPFTLANPQPADADTQSDWMLDLLLYCQDNARAVEGILTALIQGQNIAILNAPPSLETRLRFIQGLVSLLPIPARVVLTFATHVVKAENSAAQIKFMTNATPPEGHVIYDWESAELTPKNYDRHDYARFMISQLQLDPSQVIEQAENLARTASWRAIRKENLSSALHWVSRRAKIDSTIRARQPADRDTVASVLRQDPTLTDELRVLYSTHLLSFSLALREWKSADMLPAIAAGHRDVAEAIFNELRERSQDESPLQVYDLIEHWLLNVPEAKTLPWQQTLFNAALAHLQNLAQQRNHDEIATFIYRLCNTDKILQLDKVAARILLLIRPLMHQSPQVAQAALVLASDHLAAGSLQEFIGDIELVKQLPRAQQKAMALLQPEVVVNVQSQNAISDAAKTIPSDYQALVTVRFIELALHLRRPELIGDRELALLLQLSHNKQSERYQYVIKYLIDEFSQPARISSLGASGLSMLPQLYFIVGSTDEGIRLLERYQNTVFTPERLAAFSDLIGELFLRLDLESDAMLSVIAAFENSQIRPEPRVRVLCAALMNQQWSPRMDEIARQLTAMLYTDPQLLRIAGVPNALRLVQFHIDRSNTLEALRAATALMQAALKMGENGPPLLVKVWQTLNVKNDLRHASTELVRRYIRLLPLESSTNLPAYFGEQIDERLGEALRTTRLVRVITGGSDLIKFSELIDVTHHLLHDLAISYQEGRDTPPLRRLRQDLDGMTGGLSEKERQELASNLITIGQLIYQLGMQKPPRTKTWSSSSTSNSSLRIATGKTNTPPTSARATTKNLLKEARETPPQTASDFLTWLGLNFVDEFVFDLGLERISATHVLGERSAAMFYRESVDILALLRRLLAAFPDGVPLEFSAASLKSEIDTLWAEIPLAHQRPIEPTLSDKTQELGLLLRVLANKANDKVMADSGLGKQLESGRREPANEIEALRWISGYFGRKHQT